MNKVLRPITVFLPAASGVEEIKATANRACEGNFTVARFVVSCNQTLLM